MGAGVTTLNHDISSKSIEEVGKIVKEIEGGKYAVEADKFIEMGVDGIRLNNLNNESEFYDMCSKELNIEDKDVQENLLKNLTVLINETKDDKTDNTKDNTKAKPSGSNKLKRQPSGLSASQKVLKLREKNLVANKNLHTSLQTKRHKENNRLKDRLLKKKKQALKKKMDEGMDETAAEEAVLNEIKGQESVIQNLEEIQANVDAGVTDAIEAEREENNQEYYAPESYEMSMSVEYYLPIITWLFDWVLSLGGNANEEDNTGMNILMYCCQVGEPRLVESMINRGCDINSYAFDDSSPIHISAQYGHYECLEMLLNASADINHENDDGWTALIFAAIGGHYDCVKLLIDKGADLDIADADGFTALNFAEEGQHFEVAKLIRDSGAASLVDASAHVHG